MAPDFWIQTSGAVLGKMCKTLFQAGFSISLKFCCVKVFDLRRTRSVLTVHRLYQPLASKTSFHHKKADGLNFGLELS
jgi:hypothetical protein